MNSTMMLKSLHSNLPVTQDNRKWKDEGRRLMQDALSQSPQLSDRYIDVLAHIAKLITEHTGITANPQTLNGEAPGSVMHDAYLMQLDIANKIAIVNIIKRVPICFDKLQRTHHLITLLDSKLTTHPDLKWVNGVDVRQDSSGVNYGDCVLISKPLSAQKLEACMLAFEQRGLRPRLIKCLREDGVAEDRILIEKAAVATTPIYFEGLQSSCFYELLELSKQMDVLMQRLKEVRTLQRDEDCSEERGYYGVRH